MSKAVSTSVSESMDVEMDDDGVLLLQQFDVQNVEQGHDVRLELHLTRQRLVASAYVYNLSTDERTRIDVLDARRILSANTEFESMQTRAAEWTLTEAAYKGGLVERVQLRGQVYAHQARAAAEGAAADAGERGRELDLGEGPARMEGVVSDGGQGGGEDHFAKGIAV